MGDSSTGAKAAQAALVAAIVHEVPDDVEDLEEQHGPGIGDHSPSKRARYSMDHDAPLAACVESPLSSLSQREQELEGPDAALDRMVAAQRALNDAPAWALALNSSISEQVARVTTTVGRMQEQIADVERRNIERMEAFEKKQEEQALKRDDAIQTQLDTMKTELKAMQNRGTSSGIPHSVPQAPPGLGQQMPRPPYARVSPAPAHDTADEVNFNRIVIGGWRRDTPKRVIQEEGWTLARHMSEVQIDRLVVYGKRANTCQLFLSPQLPMWEAKSRFYSLQEKYSNAAIPNGPEPKWLSPARPLASRLKNKATRHAWSRLQEVCNLKAEAPVNITVEDVDWGRQVIWLMDRRALAPSLPALYLQEGEKCGSVEYRSDFGEVTKFLVNMSVLESAVSMPASQIEPILNKAI